MTYLKKLLIQTILAIFIFNPLLAIDPKDGSPLKNRSHPRMHLTEASIPQMRQILSTYFKSEYQEYVNWAANAPDNDDYNILHEAGHDPLRALLIHQAFIAAVGTVPGISYPISFEQYAQRAINRLNSRLSSGDEVAYAAALAYDWSFNFMTESERSTIAGKMRTAKVAHKVFDISVANPQLDPEQMFSSKYYETAQPWYIGLALWGDGYVDADADKAVDTFYDDMLNWGYLDAKNFVAGNSGGFSEWVGYSSWHPRTHMLNVDAWRTATGENYVTDLQGEANGNALLNYPAFMVTAMDPHKYFNQHYSYVRHGGAETTDPSFEHRSMLEQMHFLPRMLAESGYADEAGLLRHIIETYDVGFPTYPHFYLWAFLGAYQSNPSKSPADLNLPKSRWTKNLGTFFARTGFGNPADGVFSAAHSHFRFDGHKGSDDFPGFTLAKFGTLVNTRNVAHRGYGNLNDYTGARQYNEVYFEGGNEEFGGQTQSHKSMDEPHEVQDAANGAGDYDWGGFEQISRKEDYFYHGRVNNNRGFESGVSHTREYVWLPGSDPENDSDFLVVYDRTTSSSDPEWVYHVPWEPSGVSYTSTESMDGGSRVGDAYIGSNVIIKELNSLGGPRDNDGGNQDYTGGGVAHGVLFAKTLLPDQARVEATRVSSFDSDVIKRQHHLAIKSHRWQISVKPTDSQTNQKFLNIMQTADANKVTSMAANELITVGSAMHGVFVTRENSSRPNYVVMFNQSEGVNTNVVTYSIDGNGSTRHIITGLEPYTTYDITYGGNTISKITEPDMQFWDYKGVDTNTKTGVLYFENTLSGNATFMITKSGEQDETPPGKTTGFNIKP
ncbi:MAG: hypothetical protein D8M58_13115 [Calditrichaeota bacterium]|nr:MAG: hypothetical protein DWQ03_13900 [Calditrichota bacterium]MBL1206340.1 hypothetical protein [Calditrichota bacterium]NOG46166.1 hypothetical protein [Calditrichota bacterium]